MPANDDEKPVNLGIGKIKFNNSPNRNPPIIKFPEPKTTSATEFKNLLIVGILEECLKNGIKAPENFGSIDFFTTRIGCYKRVKCVITYEEL